MLAHSERERLIWIRTTRYSEFFRQLLEHYRGEGMSAVIDGRAYPASDFPQLIQRWCTNTSIRATRDFTLKRSGVSLFTFHDHPDALWALPSELPFIQQLEAAKILRYRVRTSAPSLWQRIKEFFSGTKPSVETRNT